MASYESIGKWCRACWLEGDQVYEDVCPSNWIVGKKVYWPDTGDVNMKRLKRKTPKISWQIFDLIKVKVTDDDYDLCKAYNMTDTESNVPTENDESQADFLNKSKKHRNKKLGDIEYEDEDIEINIRSEERMAIPKPPTAAEIFSRGVSSKKKIKENNQHEESFASPPKFISTPKLHKVPNEAQDKEVSVMKLSKSSGSKTSSISKRLITSSAGANVSSQSPSSSSSTQNNNSGSVSINVNPSMPKEVDFSKYDFSTPTDLPMSTQRFQHNVFERMAILDAKLDHIIKNYCLPEKEQVEIPFIENDDDMEQFENKLKERKFFKAIVSQLSPVGGKDDRNMTYNILRKVMSDQLQSTYSMAGKKKKKSFEKLSLYKVLHDSVLRKFPKSTIDEIRTFAMDHLKYAPKRLKQEEEKLAKASQNLEDSYSSDSE